MKSQIVQVGHETSTPMRTYLEEATSVNWPGPYRISRGSDSRPAVTDKDGFCSILFMRIGF